MREWSEFETQLAYLCGGVVLWLNVANDQGIGFVCVHQVRLCVADDACTACVDECLDTGLLSYSDQRPRSLYIDLVHDGAVVYVEVRACRVDNHVGLDLLKQLLHAIVVSYVAKVVVDAIFGLGRRA